MQVYALQRSVDQREYAGVCVERECAGVCSTAVYRSRESAGVC